MTLPAPYADVLAFEKRWWKHQGAKEQAMRDELDLSVPRYYQLLGAVLDMPAALQAEPVLVNHLRRQRQLKRSRR